MMRPPRLSLAAATAAFTLVVAIAQAAPLIVDFDTAPPTLLKPGGPTSLVVDANYTILGSFPLSNGVVAIDTGLTPPDPGGGVAGDLASQNCFAGICTSNGTNAVYAFGSAGFRLSLTGGGEFNATSFDAAIASNSLSRATRFEVSGYRGALLLTTTSFLLLPGGDAGFSLNPGESFPSDTASGDGNNFNTLSLSGFDSITSLTFRYIGELLSDPQSILDTGNVPEFAVDNIATTLVPMLPLTVPEPPGLLVLVGAILAFIAVKKTATSQSPQIR
jgi:hypothetical protein